MTHQPDSTAQDRPVVHADPNLADIIPVFLENRRKDVETLQIALTGNDFPTIRLLGHRMKGDGAGYGFQEISSIGDALEQTALREDRAVIAEHIRKLTTFLAQVSVIYR
jgi:HPt (histidine-containing phosphotransfer) domain-containing protein